MVAIDEVAHEYEADGGGDVEEETLRVHANGERPSSSAKPDCGKTELVMVKCE